MINKILIIMSLIFYDICKPLKLYAATAADDDSNKIFQSTYCILGILSFHVIFPPLKCRNYKVEVSFSGQSERYMCDPVLTFTSNLLAKTLTGLLVLISLVGTNM